MKFCGVKDAVHAGHRLAHGLYFGEIAAHHLDAALKQMADFVRIPRDGSDLMSLRHQLSRHPSTDETRGTRD